MPAMARAMDRDGCQLASRPAGGAVNPNKRNSETVTREGQVNGLSFSNA